jgi:hypothetical protein
MIFLLTALFWVVISLGLAVAWWLWRAAQAQMDEWLDR